MDELVKMVAEKTGLSEDMAKVAVETVVDHLKDKLPAPVAGQIDNLMGGAGAATDVGGVAKSLGGVFGKK